jgi:predicted O-methyltransferase YrrM
MEDNQTGLAATELFLTSSKYNNPNSEGWNLVINWNRIHNQLIKFNKIEKKEIYHEQELFCIVADGGWSNWTGSDINTKGVGGSETWVIEMARYIQKNTNKTVVVFCKTDRPEFFEGVGYNPIEMFHQFVAQNVISYCIISRFPEYIPVAIKGNCLNIGIIFHDILIPETIIPKHEKIKWIFGLTDWHSNTIKNMFPQHNVITMNYGIDLQKFKIQPKIKNSFIYSSFPNRGLSVLLKMWPRIQKLFPDAKLNVYCNLEQEWVNRVAKDEMIEIKERLKTLTGVIVHGWVDKQTLIHAWETAEYWFYPCKFEETFCLTALEAAISKTFVISNNLAALGETIGNRGLIVHGNALTEEWQDQVIEKLSKLEKTTKENLIEINYNWAKERSWESQAHKFANIVCMKHGWWKIKEINDYLIEKTNDSLEIIDIGSGLSPFENATYTIDGHEKATLKIDVETETIPKDIVDFVYTRHLLEDLRKPQLVLSEIKRIAKAGYIETPSVIAECTRYIDCAVNGNFGYRHHHSILWTCKNTHTLKIIPKIEEYISEFITFDKMIQFRELLTDTFLWNNYYLFDAGSPLKYEILSSTETIPKEIYFKLLDDAIESTLLNNIVFKKLILEKINYKFMMNWTNDVPKNTLPIFMDILNSLSINSKILEIGTYTGTSVIKMLNILPDSTAVVIDSWESYHEHDNIINNDTITEDISKLNIEQIFYDNIQNANVSHRIKVLKGKSSNKLLELLMEHEKFNFIYVDASHKCLDVYFDATIAWKLLKIGGVIGFDDYLFNKGDILNSPHDAINYFMEQQKDNFIVLNINYRIFLKKIN